MLKSLLELSINDIIKKYKSLFLKKENVVIIGTGFKAIKGLDTKDLRYWIIAR